MTGVSSEELLFCRKIQNKIPDLHQFSTDFEVRYLDSENKGKGKLYVDGKCCAVKSDLMIRGKVLVQQYKENKFCTPFHPKLFILVVKSGNTVGIESYAGSH